MSAFHQLDPETKRELAIYRKYAKGFVVRNDTARVAEKFHSKQDELLSEPARYAKHKKAMALNLTTLQGTLRDSQRRLDTVSDQELEMVGQQVEKLPKQSLKRIVLAPMHRIASSLDDEVADFARQASAFNESLSKMLDRDNQACRRLRLWIRRNCHIDIDSRHSHIECISGLYCDSGDWSDNRCSTECGSGESYCSGDTGIVDEYWCSGGWEVDSGGGTSTDYKCVIH